MLTKLFEGDALTTLTVAGTEYWRVGSAKPIPPYIQNQNQVQATTTVYSVTGNDEIELGTTNEIVDQNGKVFKPLIGGRPRNIYKR